MKINTNLIEESSLQLVWHNLANLQFSFLLNDRLAGGYFLQGKLLSGSFLLLKIFGHLLNIIMSPRHWENIPRLTLCHHSSVELRVAEGLVKLAWLSQVIVSLEEMPQILV